MEGYLPPRWRTERRRAFVCHMLRAASCVPRVVCRVLCAVLHVLLCCVAAARMRFEHFVFSVHCVLDVQRFACVLVWCGWCGACVSGVA